MPWFWKTLWSGIVGTVVLVFGWIAWSILLNVLHAGPYVAFSGFVLLLLGSQCIAVLANHDPLDKDTETRCRRCRYILRGIAEPRCPECGERI